MSNPNEPSCSKNIDNNSNDININNSSATYKNSSISENCANEAGISNDVVNESNENAENTSVTRKTTTVYIKVVNMRVNPIGNQGWRPKITLKQFLEMSPGYEECKAERANSKLHEVASTNGVLNGQSTKRRSNMDEIHSSKRRKLINDMKDKFPLTKKGAVTASLMKSVINSAIETLYLNNIYSSIIDSAVDTVIDNVADHIFSEVIIENYYKLFMEEAQSLCMKSWAKKLLSSGFEDRRIAQLCPQFIEDNLDVLHEEIDQNYKPSLMGLKDNRLTGKNIDFDEYFRLSAEVIKVYLKKRGMRGLTENDYKLIGVLLLCPSRIKLLKPNKHEILDKIFILKCMDFFVDLRFNTQFFSMFFIQDKYFIARMFPEFINLLEEKVRIYNKLPEYLKKLLVERIKGRADLFLNSFTVDSQEHINGKLIVDSLTTEYIIFGDIVRPVNLWQ